MWTFFLCFPRFKLFLIFLSSPARLPWRPAAEPALSGRTACSSRMLLVLGQRLGFLSTPTTPFSPGRGSSRHKSEWWQPMDVSKYVSLTASFYQHFPFPFSPSLSLHRSYDCSFHPLLRGLTLTCSRFDRSIIVSFKGKAYLLSVLRNKLYKYLQTPPSETLRV